MNVFVTGAAGFIGGSIATGWVGHVSEIQWTEDG